MPKRSESKPWERREGESAKAFEAFSVYLYMGTDRSLREVAEKLGKSRALIERWSRTHEWVKRATAYDDDVRRKAASQAHAQAIQKSRNMADRHIKIALEMQSVALKALAKLNVEEIDPKNIIAMLREATKLERENRADVLQLTAEEDEEHGGSSSLADLISEAWERRNDGEC